jgi:K+-transporting ATPase ATPase C chain
MPSFIASIRLTLTTLLVCVGGYTAVILGAAQLLTPETADGSLITRADGRVVGSRLIAQKFVEPRYVWPRPSAVDYNGAGAGGSNKSPTSSDVTDRAREIAAQYGASPERPLPPELAAASGGGLDPHISERAALYQAERVAGARGIPRARVEALIAEHAFRPGGPITRDRIVNVLELNLALDGALDGAPAGGASSR